MLTEDFHNSLVEVMCLGQYGCPRMFLEQVVLHSQIGYENGKVEAAATTADNYHWDVHKLVSVKMEWIVQ
jgi:hypothetical protein